MSGDIVYIRNSSAVKYGIFVSVLLLLFCYSTSVLLHFTFVVYEVDEVRPKIRKYHSFHSIDSQYALPPNIPAYLFIVKCSFVYNNFRIVYRFYFLVLSSKCIC